jgi:4-hydroxybenzoate polyprenyltransferase/phosphoserine phosphatase
MSLLPGHAPCASSVRRGVTQYTLAYISGMPIPLQDHRDRELTGVSAVPGVGDALDIRSVPIVVDLDGTLTPTDTLLESMIQVIKQDIFNILLLMIWLLKGRAAFKHFVASRANFSAKDLPYRVALLDYLAEERQRGRRMILATAAHRSIADAVALHLGLFDQVLATDAGVNLKGAAKLRAIQEAVGGRYVYAGDSHADLPIWKSATAAILVATSRQVANTVRGATAIEREFSREPAPWTIWLRALRVHQWLKNLLLFVPLLTAFSFLQWDKVGTLIVAFFAFSFAASATYLVNDLWDLENDRAHPRKRNRPFASGRLPIFDGLVVAGLVLAMALAMAAAVSWAFLLILLVYLAGTSAYSWMLKRRVLMDVLTLSMLYTLRILAGAVAVNIAVTYWLLAFSVFVFFSLALVKRCAELVSLGRAGARETRGRDYLVTDLAVLWPLGIGSALCAIVVFGLFINDADTMARYSSPRLLWLVALALVYWLSRLWIKSVRGEMDDDPLIFALRDRASRMTVLFMLGATLAARFVVI